MSQESRGTVTSRLSGEESTDEESIPEYVTLSSCPFNWKHHLPNNHSKYMASLIFQKIKWVTKCKIV